MIQVEAPPSEPVAGAAGTISTVGTSTVGATVPAEAAVAVAAAMVAAITNLRIVYSPRKKVRLTNLVAKPALELKNSFLGQYFTGIV